MDNNCLVSVIMLTYNHRPYIMEAIESILMQKVSFKYEILIGDDCSTDGTQDILRIYEKQYPGIIKLFLRQENIGATRNLFELYTKTSGKYLATLEGDDYWTDDRKLQVQVEFLENYNEYIGCAHQFIVVDKSGNTIHKRVNWVTSREVYTYRDFDGIILPGQASTIVKRNIFLNSQYDYSIIHKADPIIGDRIINMIYLSHGDFFIIKKVMGHYRYVADKGEQNATSLVYMNKGYSCLRDYELLCKMEKYSLEVLKKRKIFRKRKYEFCLKELLKYISTNSRLHLTNFRTMIKRETLIYFFIYLPIGLLQILIRKFRAFL